MFKILILPVIGVVFILQLRSQKKELPILKERNEKYYRYSGGKESNYLESWKENDRKL